MMENAAVGQSTTAASKEDTDTTAGDIGLMNTGPSSSAVRESSAKTPMPSHLTFAKRQLAWHKQVDSATIRRAWRSLNGGYSHYDYSFAEFENALAAAGVVAATQDAFADLSVENTCKLDVADEVAAAALAVDTKLLEPLILARFETRTVILDGNTRYRASLLCQSDIHYICVSMDQTSCCVHM